MVKGIVLDVDDTLYLERDYVASGFDFIETWCASNLGVSGVGQAAWELFIAGKRRTTITDALAHLRIMSDEKLTAALVQAYREHPPRITMLPDARRFVHRVKGHQRISVVTDGPAASQSRKCAALGVAEFAEPIVISAQLGTSKPDPEVFAAATALWGLEPRDLVCVADNPAKDFLAPMDMGWRCVRVRRRGSLHFDAPTPPGVLEVEDLDDPALDELVTSFRPTEERGVTGRHLRDAR